MLVRQVLDMGNCPTNLFHENFSWFLPKMKCYTTFSGLAFTYVSVGIDMDNWGKMKRLNKIACIKDLRKIWAPHEVQYQMKYEVEVGRLDDISDHKH